MCPSKGCRRGVVGRIQGDRNACDPFVAVRGGKEDPGSDQRARALLPRAIRVRRLCEQGSDRGMMVAVRDTIRDRLGRRRHQQQRRNSHTPDLWSHVGLQRDGTARLRCLQVKIGVHACGAHPSTSVAVGTEPALLVGRPMISGCGPRSPHAPSFAPTASFMAVPDVSSMCHSATVDAAAHAGLWGWRRRRPERTPAGGVGLDAGIPDQGLRCGADLHAGVGRRRVPGGVGYRDGDRVRARPGVAWLALTLVWWLVGAVTVPEVEPVGGGLIRRADLVAGAGEGVAD
jgi:hypothetical protein